MPARMRALLYVAVALPLLASCAAMGPNYLVRGECSSTAVNGPYQLVLPDGTVQVTGLFVEGLRDGVFTYYRSSGEKIAELSEYGQQKTSRGHA